MGPLGPDIPLPADAPTPPAPAPAPEPSAPLASLTAVASSCPLSAAFRSLAITEQSDAAAADLPKHPPMLRRMLGGGIAGQANPGERLYGGGRAPPSMPVPLRVTGVEALLCAPNLTPTTMAEIDKLPGAVKRKVRALVAGGRLRKAHALVHRRDGNSETSSSRVPGSDPTVPEQASALPESVSEPVPSVGDAAAQQREAVVTAERAKERSTPAAPPAAPPTAWISLLETRLLKDCRVQLSGADATDLATEMVAQASSEQLQRLAASVPMLEAWARQWLRPKPPSAAWAARILSQTLSVEECTAMLFTCSLQQLHACSCEHVGRFAHGTAGPDCVSVQ